MARTINSPGVEIFERDESETSSLQAGTNILVQGFAHQGPTNELIRISSKDELNQVYFGGNGPTNDAERFFYHSCAEILNSPANLYTIRLPYGLSDGEGFSGKYVALAYGGQVRPQPVTKIVRRMVQLDKDFIPEDEPIETLETPIDLYEFSEKTIKQEGDTALYYALVAEYVQTVLGEQLDEGESPFKYASAFPLNDEHFWVAPTGNRATSIDISPKSSSYAPKYKYLTYTPTDGLEFEVSYATAHFDASALPDYNAAEWVTPSSSGDASFKVKFENIGTFTKEFLDNVLNAAIDAYKEDGKTKVNGVHPFNALDTLYTTVDLGEAGFNCYKIDYGMSLSQWRDAINTQLDSSAVSGYTKLGTEYEDANLISVYAKTAAGRVDTRDMIVDTETIGNTIIDQFNTLLSDESPALTGSITFKNGIPLQDKETMSLFYNGPLSTEAIVEKTFGRRYTINQYQNKLATKHIKEWDFEEPQYDETTHEPITENVLTLNPVPLAVPLTEYQYTAIQEGAIKWSDLVYDLNGEGTGEDAFRTILGKSAFYVVNKMQTSIDDKYQGFYVAFMDSSKFYEQAYGNISNSYDAIKKIDYVGTPTDSGDVQIGTLPDDTLGFDVVGPESLSTDIMSGVVGIDLSKPENSDNLVVATVRCGRRASSSDPSKLSYDLKDVRFGSFNMASTVVDPVTKGVVPNRIDTKMQTNDYVELVVNPKFQYVSPEKVKFGGADYADKDQEAGSCCSLGVEVPCVEDNKSEYIGNIPGKLDKSLSLCDNVYDFDLDILVDAGLSTIWAYVKEDDEHGACEFNASKYIENNVGTPYELLTRSGDAYAESPYYQAFDTIRIKYNDFCAKTRKDCMYLLDPLRACFVRGKDTKLLSIDGKIFTIDVARPLRNLFSDANSSYGAAYANWVKIYDSFSDEYIWMPSSPFEASIMARVDANYYPWYAPYGLNNGILSSISDIALRFSPKQQDDIYKMGLNMFVFFNGDGFVSWGQKTLQTKQSALDRINVRRLFLTLERATFKTVRYFIAEPNTPFTRTRVINSISPLFDTAKHNEGCYDYKIFCDERNNTAQVIDNNELVIDVYIKPTRVIDFIEVTFHATKTDANFEELYNG